MPIAANELTAEFRSKVIGGSDAGTIIGVNPYKKPIELFMEKRGLVEPTDVTLPMRLGNILEPTIIQIYQEQTGNTVKPGGEMIVHPSYDWCIVHLDGVVTNIADKGFEAKTANPFMIKFWGEPGTDDIPEMYIAQCQHAMAVTGLKSMDVAVLIGNSEERIYTVLRNDKFIEAMLSAELNFMAMVKDPTCDPDETLADNSEAWAKYLKFKYPVNTDEVIEVGDDDADEEIRFNLVNLWQCRKDIKKHQAKEQGFKNDIMAFMGNAKKLISPDGGRISWTKSKDRDVVNWEKVAKDVIAQWVGPEVVYEGIIKNNTTTKPGPRSFRPTPPKEEK